MLFRSFNKNKAYKLHMELHHPSTGDLVCLVFVKVQLPCLDLEPKDSDMETMNAPLELETLPK